MYQNWTQLINQKPRELILTGDKFSKQIEEENGINSLLFKISSINFLEISKTCLSHFPSQIELLNNLTNLLLRENKLTELPLAIGKLDKLKYLDVSYNNLISLPDNIGDNLNLQSLVLSSNSLTTLPSSISNLSNLLVIKIDQNAFTQFPECLCSENCRQHLSEIYAQRNQIANIPHTINILASLKVLNLSENNITYVPGQLGDCSKLKELNLTGNKLIDRKLFKLVEQGKQKSIVDYIKNHCQRCQTDDQEMSKNTTNAKSALKTKEENTVSLRNSQIEDLTNLIKILTIKREETRLVIVTSTILESRKIVCCIVRNVNFYQKTLLRNFISIQTDIHDGVLCSKRKSATIATHDLSKVIGNVTFDLRPPSKIRIHPLGRFREMSASELYKTLNDEAEAYRKEKKRNTYSGIHKYLLLLKGKQRYPCLIDSSNKVISFPPITNSELTKVTEETKDLFIEVTGESQPICKKVMDSFLHSILRMGVSGELDEKGDIKRNILQVEPVKVVDTEGKLYVFYPSKVDLFFDDISVTRGVN